MMDIGLQLKQCKTSIKKSLTIIKTKSSFINYNLGQSYTSNDDYLQSK